MHQADETPLGPIDSGAIVGGALLHDVPVQSEGVEAELAEARKAWRFTCKVEVSRSDPRGRILWVEGLARA